MIVAHSGLVQSDDGDAEPGANERKTAFVR